MGFSFLCPYLWQLHIESQEIGLIKLLSVSAYIGKRGNLLAEIGKSSISDRIRQVRKALGLSQSESGEGIRVSQVYIGNIEQETRKVNDRIIMLVCSGYGVNETWLRQGKGKMFDKKTCGYET
jgi:DNA-binding XRE family transcriptional regulator